MAKVVIAMSLGSSGIIAGGLINGNGEIEDSIPCSSGCGKSLKDRCSELVQEGLRRCSRLGFQPMAIGVSTNGEVRDGRVLGRNFKGDEGLLQKTLEERFHLPTKVMNRFHACALGVSHILQDNGSLGVVNVSNAVGYGMVSAGKVREHYDPVKGAGGLRKIERHSDGKTMSIANIAGISAMLDRFQDSKMTGLHQLFAKVSSGSSLAKKIENDAAEAVAELAGDLHTSFSPERLAALVYSREPLTKREREVFLGRVQEKVKNKYPQAPEIQLVTHLSEEDAKLVGVAKAAMERIASDSKMHEPEPLFHSQNEKGMGDHLFAVTGSPASGKTTFVAETLLKKLQEHGVRVGGVISKELRNQKERTGFVMKSLYPGKGWSEAIELAVVEKYAPPNTDHSKYKRFVAPVSTFLVNVQNVTDSIVPELQKIQQAAEVIIIDEVATMQLFSKDFENAVEEILHSKIPTIVTIPERSKSGLVQRIRTVTERNGLLCVLDAKDRSRSQRIGERQLMPRLLDEIEKYRAVKSEKAEFVSRTYISQSPPRKRARIGE